MSLYVAVAMAKFGFVAGDSLFVARDGRRVPGYRKISATPAGWVTGGTLTDAMELLGPALASCRTPEAMRDVIVEAQDYLEEIAAAAPAECRASTLCYVVTPGDLASLDWRTGELEHRGLTAALGGPLGAQPEDFDELFAEYGQRLMRLAGALPDPRTLRRAIDDVAWFYREAFEQVGDKALMGSDVEIGFVRRTPQGLEHLHCLPTPSATANANALHIVRPAEVRFGWISQTPVEAPSRD